MVEDKDRRGRILKKKKGYRQNQRKNNINNFPIIREGKYLTKEKGKIVREVRKPEDSHGGQERNFYRELLSTWVSAVFQDAQHEKREKSQNNTGRRTSELCRTYIWFCCATDSST